LSRLRGWLSGLIKVRSTADMPTVSEEAESESLEASARDFNPLPAELSGAEKSSDEIFAEIGRHLRARRELLSLTYEEVERHTRVRSAFLKALEEGVPDELPSPVQTRGILSNYAGFLDLDVEAVLLRFADGVQARYRERRPVNPKRSRSPMTVNTSLPPLRTFIASDLVFGGGMAIMLLLFAIWGISRVVVLRSNSHPQATAPSISDVLAGTPIPTQPQEVTLIPVQDTAQAPLDATATLDLATLGPNINIQLNIVSVERTYMRVSVDGKVQFEGRTTPGTAYSYDARSQIDILVGNAAALKITLNGRDLGLMGNFGEVIDRVYTVQGAVTPTSTQPPTATATPNITLTPSQTPTRTPSATPTPTSGG
jgi:cytoskeletal protein RodZ